MKGKWNEEEEYSAVGGHIAQRCMFIRRGVFSVLCSNVSVPRFWQRICAVYVLLFCVFGAGRQRLSRFGFYLSSEAGDTSTLAW